MSSLYRFVLFLLPSALRHKHGEAMHALFVREVANARINGTLYGAIASAVGIWDVVQRAAYEHSRAHAPATTHNASQTLDAVLDSGAMSMNSSFAPPPATRQLLARLALAFVFAFVALTTVLLFIYARRRIGAGDDIWTTVLLALPFTSAMTIPMAVFVAVLYEFGRLGASGTLDAARHIRDGIRRLAVPVLAASVGVATFAFVVTAEIVPRTNARLSSWGNGRFRHNDRSLTIGELVYAASKVSPGQVRNEDGVPIDAKTALSISASYHVEIHKKFAMPAACIVLALAAMAIAFHIPRGGIGLVIGASITVFGTYYVVLMKGEELADSLVVSPFLAMWGANALMLGLVLLASLALWRRRSSPAVRAPEIA